MIKILPGLFVFDEEKALSPTDLITQLDEEFRGYRSEDLKASDGYKPYFNAQRLIDIKKIFLKKMGAARMSNVGLLPHRSLTTSAMIDTEDIPTDASLGSGAFGKVGKSAGVGAMGVVQEIAVKTEYVTKASGLRDPSIPIPLEEEGENLKKLYGKRDNKGEPISIQTFGSIRDESGNVHLGLELARGSLEGVISLIQDKTESVKLAGSATVDTSDAKAIERVRTRKRNLALRNAFWHDEDFYRFNAFERANILGLAFEVLNIGETHEQHRIVHRDIKPANFLITRNYRLLAADLGSIMFLDGYPGGLSEFTKGLNRIQGVTRAFAPLEVFNW